MVTSSAPFTDLPDGSLIRLLPGPVLLPFFAMKIPQMIIPCADAAAVILEHVHHKDMLSRRRVGIALPAAMKGQKEQWVAKARADA